MTFSVYVSIDRDIQTLGFISPGREVAPCCQLGLSLELCLCTVLCVIYFPREELLRWHI